MAFSKTQRIITLLVIDAVFFLLELVVGQAVHSLALVADSFHMLNDVLSLCVALWAVRVATTRTSSKMYTYGWQRAEILGALINGVFLVALCVSIFLEAIQRFIDPPKITNPMLVLIVGCAGFASNVVGLFLFHDHSHSHGDDGHATDPLNAVEAGHLHFNEEEAERRRFADPRGNIEEVMPQNAVGAGAFQSFQDTPKRNSLSSRRDISKSEETYPINTPGTYGANGNIHKRHRRQTSSSLGRGFGSLDNIHVHPATLRHEWTAAGQRRNDSDSESTSSGLEDEDEDAIIEDPTVAPSSGQKNQGLKLLSSSHGSPSKSSRSRTKSRSKHGHTHSYNKTSPNPHNDHRHDSLHNSHHHSNPEPTSSKGHGHGHSHSHGDSNMRGVFLHVLGDALGNIGVIASALFIWQTKFSWRFYMDPTISVIITIIILWSAIPLCLSTSRILLQGVPDGMSIDKIKEDIENLPGIKSVHHLHVWALSESKSIASLHVKVDCGTRAEGRGSASYMHLALQIRRCLHEFGIHSSTIQPEFCTKEEGELEEEEEDGEGTPILAAQRDSFVGAGTMARGNENIPPGGTTENGEARVPRRVANSRKACVLECVEECEPTKRCCGNGKGEDRG